MHAPTPANAPARNERIDILRGVAICGVLILHFTLGYGLKDSPLGAALPAWLLKGLALNGNYGVTMFFAVSGFLITQISLRRWGRLSAIDLPTFYVYRAARILPPLLPALAIIVVLDCLGLPRFANTDGGHHLPASTFVVAVGSVPTFWHNVLAAVAPKLRGICTKLMASSGAPVKVKTPLATVLLRGYAPERGANLSRATPTSRRSCVGGRRETLARPTKRQARATQRGQEKAFR